MSTDRRTIQLVIIMVGLIALTLAAGMLFLNANNQKIDPVLSTLGAGALGALTAMLVSTRSGSSDAAPVAVVNTDPIPVTDTPGKHDSAAEDVGTDLPSTDLTGA